MQLAGFRLNNPIEKNHAQRRNRCCPGGPHQVVGDGTACTFGQWLHANKEALPYQDQFEYIEALHAIFHIAAAEMATAAKSTQNHKEIKRQTVDLQNLSNQLIAALGEVRASLYPLGRSPMPETRPATNPR